MKSAQYRHIIKHLETEHLDHLPVVIPRREATRRVCSEKSTAIVAARNTAIEKISAAEALFSAQFQDPRPRPPRDLGFARRASGSIFGKRRRLDAWTYNPEAAAIEVALREQAIEWQSLGDIGCQIWLPNRFRRVPAEDGLELVDSSSIFEINPDPGRRIAADQIADRNGGMVELDWLMMSRSGQIYGLLGSVVLATTAHEGKVVSDDVIRIDTNSGIDPGYLYVVLSHNDLGRPRVKALAYGSSIPHIEVEDLKQLGIPRLESEVEQAIGSLAREAFASWASADAAENEMAEIAEQEIADFLAAS